MPADIMTPKPFVKYVVIVRDGMEVVCSYLPFMQSYNKDFAALWNAPKLENYDQLIDIMDSGDAYHR